MREFINFENATIACKARTEEGHCREKKVQCSRNSYKGYMEEEDICFFFVKKN